MSLTELFAAAPEREDLVVHDGRRVSTSVLDALVTQVAGGLAERGVTMGDRVAFQLPVGIDSVLVYRACWRLGAVAVALHPMAGTAQVAVAIAQADPTLRIAAHGFALADDPTSETVADLHGSAPPRSRVGGDADALIMFTSGSTGAPKGVVHTHASLRYKAEQSVEVHGFSPADTVLMPAPLAHISGLLHGVLVAGAVGMKAVLMSRWEPGVALDLIEREQVTYMVGPPTFFVGLMDHPEFHPERTGSLRLLSCGGAGVTPAFADRAHTELGAIVKRAYGSTEAPTVTTSRFDDPPDRMINTDGRAFGETRVRVDADGELWVTGPELARGYLDAQQTEASFVDGWFRTGDLATLEDGWLTITGRLGDRIIRGGENISAAEVEQHLEAHPDVRAAVAIAEPDDRLGERVAAFVVAPVGFDLDTCRSWFTERGATRFITPERVVVIDEMPVLASGKPDRAMLRDRLSEVSP